MPMPGFSPVDHELKAPRRALEQIAPAVGSASGESSIARELAALRQEVAALRELLAPPSSVILVGPEAAWMFKRLVAEKGANHGG